MKIRRVRDRGKKNEKERRGTNTKVNDKRVPSSLLFFLWRCAGCVAGTGEEEVASGEEGRGTGRECVSECMCAVVEGGGGGRKHGEGKGGTPLKRVIPFFWRRGEEEGSDNIL